MARSALVRESIFDNMEQIMNHVDPSKIGLLGDRVLIQDLPDDDERHGSLVIPEMCRNNEKIRQGIIIACGPGDSCIERVIDKNAVDHEGRPYLRRKAVTLCKCGHRQTYHISIHSQNRPCDHKERNFGDMALSGEECGCESFEGRLPMETRPGDRVLYTRRRDEEIYIEGVRFTLCHEGQAVLAVLG